jgi:hypothetical protein
MATESPKTRCKDGSMFYPGEDGLPRIECSRRDMLSVLTKTFRVKAAIVLAVLYALCILAPAVAFAFSEDPAVAHCLTEEHVGIHAHGSKHDRGKLHVHADGSTHQHHDDAAPTQRASDEGKGAIATCCGLFSVVAIPGEPVPSFGLYSLASVILPVLGEALSGRGPESINRPPIV